MRIVLRRLDDVAVYFTAKPLPAAASFGAWSSHVKDALGFATVADATLFTRMALRHEEPFISFVDLDVRETQYEGER